VILRWPIREGLLKYLELIKADAQALYYRELELYGQGLLKEKPKLPRILRDGH
jgi:hypothetical protein